MSVQRDRESATQGPGRSEAVTFDRRRLRTRRLTNGAGTRSPASEENGAGPPCPRLYERDAWLEELKSTFTGSWPRSSTVIIEGASGLGKTALLNSACRLAREAHLDVLYARGGELEADCPFGVTRQLFRPILARLDSAELARCDAGSAARFLQTVGQPSGSRETDRLGVLDDLHGLLMRLAARRRLLVVVDDLQWCDRDSSAWLHYIARRLEPGRTWFLGTTRPDPAGAAEQALDHILGEPSTRVFSLRPLMMDSVAHLVRRTFVDTDEDFVQACHSFSGGNPFLLFALLEALEANETGLHLPSPDRIASLAPPSVLRSIRARLASLPSEAHGLLQAVAVLENQAEIHIAAKLAGIEDGVANQVAEALAEIHLLNRDKPLRFVYPLERSTVYGEMRPARRARAHAEAARLLDATGTAVEDVAYHLLATEPAGDDWSVGHLDRAAQQFLGQGSAELAAACLRRALLEPPSTGLRAQILLDSASAEAELGLPSALGHLREASELGVDPVLLAGPALRLVQVPSDHTHPCEDVVTLEQLAGRLGPEHDDLRLRLRVSAAVMTPSASGARSATAAIESLLDGNLTGRTQAQRLALAHLSFTLTCDPGRATAAEVADLAQRALQDDELLLDDVIAVRVTARALMALVSAGRFEIADRLALRIAPAAALQAGSETAVAYFSNVLAYSLFLRGALVQAETESRRALAATEGRPWFSRPTAVALLSAILTEEGRTAEAAGILGGAIEDANPTTAASLLPLVQRGRLRLVEGRGEEALEDLLLAGRLAEDWKIRNPAVTSWRTTLSVALHATGALHEARELATENLELARAFGSSWALGKALRVAAEVAAPADGFDLLTEAVSVLESSGAWLEQAWATVDLGVALGRQGRQNIARATLRRGADLAARCGAMRIVDRAARELRATGARPRRLALTGTDALTPSERRVTDLAAAGKSNSRIAESLYVTEKTVEGHLTRAYQKLGIRSREQLRSSPIENGEDRGIAFRRREDATTFG